MFEVTYSIDGVIQKANIPASDISGVYNAVTNMYGTGKIQIINIRRI